MSDSIAVTGAVNGYRTTRDGTLIVSIELDELQSAKFTQGFSVHCTVVVARLNESETSGEG